MGVPILIVSVLSLSHLDGQRGLPSCLLWALPWAEGQQGSELQSVQFTWFRFISKVLPTGPVSVSAAIPVSALDSEVHQQ